MKRVMLFRLWTVLAVAFVSGCRDSEQSRLDQLESILPHVRKMPEGRHPAHSLPPEIRVPGSSQFVVDHRGIYSFEFMSGVTIGSNPAFVYVDSALADPEERAKEICKTASLIYDGSGSRPGWYRAHGQ